MKRSHSNILLLLLLVLISCATSNKDTDSDRLVTDEVVQPDNPYAIWSDSIKSLGLKGDIEGARTILSIFKQACIDDAATSPDFDYQREEGRKMLYISWGNVISFLFNQGEILEAIDEVQAMQKYAENAKDDFGIAMVELSYGGLYTYSFEKSIEHLRHALSYWEKSQNVAQMQYTYYMLSRELIGQVENSDSAAMSNRLYDEVLTNCQMIVELDSTNIYMKQVSEYQKFLVYVAIKDQDAAHKSYEIINEWWRNDKVIPQLRGMIANTMAQYLVAFDNPALATPLLKEIGMPLYRLQTERKQAIALNDYQRATQLQGEIDKINVLRINQLQQNQLAIANAAFNNLQLERDNHELEIERVEKERMLLVISIISVALIILFIILLIYQRGINQKNLELVQRIKKQETTDKENLRLTENNAEKLTQWQQIFLHIEQLLQNTDILAEPNLDREMIASKLGTNRTYVAKAISEGTNGKSVSAYINELRVKLGLRMLEDAPQKSIAEIVQECGFSSRSHFHNLFVAQYGMTPAQFRKTLKKL